MIHTRAAPTGVSSPGSGGDASAYQERRGTIETCFDRTAVRAWAALTDWAQGRTRRVSSGFYTSQALELVRAQP